MPKKRKRQDKYDAQLKIAISQEYLSTDLGITSLSKKYNIEKTTIRDFVTWYKNKYNGELVTSSAQKDEVVKKDHPHSESDLKVIAL